MKHLSFLLFFCLFFSCFKNAQDLALYKNIIPQEETVNASLMHYEILCKKIQLLYEKKAYYEVFSNIDFYYKIFNQDDDNDFIDYYLGKTINHVINEKEFFYHMEKMDSNLRFVYAVRKNKVNKKNLLVYTNTHFLKIIQEKNNYEIEKKAMREILKNDFKKLEYLSGLKIKSGQIDWVLKRYPDLIKDLKELVVNENFNLLSLQSKEIADFLKLYESNHQGFALIAFSKNYFNILRNRMHSIRSRNLLKLELWEPITVIGKNLIGEDGEKWCYVKGHLGIKGYVLQKSLLFLTDEKELKKAKKYLKICHYFYNKRFIKVVKEVSALLNNASIKKNIWEERCLVLLYRSLGEIAKRATSKNNPYTHFVYRYKGYFYLDHTKKSIISSDLVLKQLISLNRNSVFLPYFLSF